MSVPPMVIGWSHKYHEIMSKFGLEELVIDYNKVSDKLLVSKFNSLLANNKHNTKVVEKHLPMMRKDSMKQIDYICSKKK
jgi:polysaccharide pyruvyl transferase WcaK-like protein